MRALQIYLRAMFIAKSKITNAYTAFSTYLKVDVYKIHSATNNSFMFFLKKIIFWIVNFFIILLNNLARMFQFNFFVLVFNSIFLFIFFVKQSCIYTKVDVGVVYQSISILLLRNWSINDIESVNKNSIIVTFD